MIVRYAMQLGAAELGANVYHLYFSPGNDSAIRLGDRTNLSTALIESRERCECKIKFLSFAR